MSFEPENLVPLVGTTLENVEAALGDVKQVAPEVWKLVESTMQDEIRRVETQMTMMVSDIHTGYQTRHDEIAAKLETAENYLRLHRNAAIFAGVLIVGLVLGYFV